jgi:hypothetical protein
VKEVRFNPEVLMKHHVNKTNLKLERVQWFYKLNGKRHPKKGKDRNVHPSKLKETGTGMLSERLLMLEPSTEVRVPQTRKERNTDRVNNFIKNAMEKKRLRVKNFIRGF